MKNTKMVKEKIISEQIIIKPIKNKEIKEVKEKPHKKLLTFKVFVKDPKESEKVQKLLGKNGIYWAGETLDTIVALPSPCFIIARGTVLTYIKCATNNIQTYTIEDINKISKK